MAPTSDPSPSAARPPAPHSPAAHPPAPHDPAAHRPGARPPAPHGPAARRPAPRSSPAPLSPASRRPVLRLPTWSDLDRLAGSTRVLRWGMNIWPPMLFAGIRVVAISDDARRVRVRLARTPLTSNYVGTQFGGSIFAMTDPFWMLLTSRALGAGYTVWDRRAEIEFLRPGRTALTADFHLTDELLAHIRDSADVAARAGGSSNGYARGGSTADATGDAPGDAPGNAVDHEPDPGDVPARSGSTADATGDATGDAASNTTGEAASNTTGDAPGDAPGNAADHAPDRGDVPTRGGNGAYLHWFTTDVRDSAGEVVARVRKQIHVRRRPDPSGDAAAAGPGRAARGAP